MTETAQDVLTWIVILLDRSGSMNQRRTDHEGGLRSFVRDQRRLPGDVRLTFIRFDDRDSFELVHDRAPLADVTDESLELIPRGNTPLLDALGQTLAYIESSRATADQIIQGEQVILLVITDGEENASRTYTKAKVQEAARALEAAEGNILYLGANVDEFREAGMLGVASARSAGYTATPQGVATLYETVTSNISQARNLSRTGQAEAAREALNFTAAQREAMKPGAEAPPADLPEAETP